MSAWACRGWARCGIGDLRACYIGRRHGRSNGEHHRIYIRHKTSKAESCSSDRPVCFNPFDLVFDAAVTTYQAVVTCKRLITCDKTIQIRVKSISWPSNA